MSAKVTGAYDLGDDRLRVVGKIDDKEVEAYGWVSALSNHYPENAYDADGNLRLKDDVREGVIRVRGVEEDDSQATGRALGDPAAKARKMNKAEKLDYCKRLLEEQNPPAGGRKLPGLSG